MSTTNQRELFASNLNRYMKARGVTQADIVAKLSVTSSTASDWANGKKYPRVEAMQRLADMLSIRISDLTGEHDDTNIHQIKLKGAHMDTPWREKEFLSAKDIAGILDIHLNTAYQIIKSLPHIQFGARCGIRINRAAFEQWLKNAERASR